MPELPEVENIAMGLRKEVLGQQIDMINVMTPSIIINTTNLNLKHVIQSMTGSHIQAISRRGKRLLMYFDNSICWLIQLGMTGQFLIEGTRSKQLKHTHTIFKLNDNRELRFVDTRRFGRIWLIHELDIDSPDRAMEEAGMSKMGPEPWEISTKEFRLISKSSSPIKTKLLDQRFIAGLGNIYADESLFASKIHPTRPCFSLSTTELNRLRRQITLVLDNAIKHGGTTFRDYRNPYGDMGQFHKRLNVYQRTGLPCKRCKTPIEKLVLQTRSSHFCPKCQPVA